MNIYSEAPIAENEDYKLRLVSISDCDDLFKTYSDKNALPFFNSDNCNGDNFYYDTKEKMLGALSFWEEAYKNGWFVRLSIINKTNNEVIGTSEVCLRVSNDHFNNMTILRVDVRSDYEDEGELKKIFGLIVPNLNEWIGFPGVLTKAPIYAVERIKALSALGFNKSSELVSGANGLAYDGYWTIE